MAREVLKRDFKVGDRIKLKDYEEWTDYSNHRDQEAIIKETLMTFDSFDFSIKWKDTTTSSVKESNLILSSGDWDE